MPDTTAFHDALMDRAGLTGQPVVTESGIYELSHEIYHGDSFPAPALSAGVIKDLVLKTPLHAWIKHPALNPSYVEETSDSFDIGTAAHAMLLEGVDKMAFIDAADWRTNEAKAKRDKARLDGLIPLLPHQYASVHQMVNAAKAFIGASNVGVRDLCAEGVSESSWVWMEGETWMKIRPDWISHDKTLIIDYKTTGQSADPDGIAKMILSMGYHLQESFYRRGVQALTGEMPRFVFLFQETSEPYLCSFISLSGQFTEMADWRVNGAIETWQECLAKNNWPAYPLLVCYPELPGWALAQYQTQLMIEEDCG